jgi:hypothetical protein
MVECESIYGDHKLIPKEKLVFRPSVYAIIVHDGKIALVTNQSSGNHFPPGGGVEIGESSLEAEKPRWTKLNSVRAKDFQICGEKILQLAHELAQL